MSNGHYVCLIKLTDGFLDDNLSCSLQKGSNTDGILCSYSEEVGLSRCEVMSHSVLSAGGVGQRRPGFALSLTFLNNEVAYR